MTPDYAAGTIVRSDRWRALIALATILAALLHLPATHIGNNMRKTDELTRPTSCLNKATPQEMLFVLLARDQAAPATIRFWCQLRVAKGKNKSDDPQIVEAMACADEMERTQAKCEKQGA